MTDPSQPNKWEQNIMQKVLMASVSEQKSARRWGIFFKGAFLVYFIILLVALWPRERSADVLEPHTALINVEGMISQGSEANADSIVTSLRKAFEESNVKGIIMRINSPGGSPVQAAYIYDEMVRLRSKHEDKKIYAVISDVGASAAYYVASAADEIYANGASLVGSIGVLLPSYGFTETMKLVGAEQRSIVSGKNKMMLDPFSPVEDNHVEFAKKITKNAHNQFIKAVKDGRGDKLKSNEEIFSGLVWLGEQSLELGLIDGLGSSSYVAREIIGHDKIVNYSVSANLFDRMANKLGASAANQTLNQLGFNGGLR